MVAVLSFNYIMSLKHYFTLALTQFLFPLGNLLASPFEASPS